MKPKLQGKKQRWREWFWVAVFALLAWFLLQSVWSLVAKQRLTEKEETLAQGELAELLARKAELEKKIDSLETKRGVEAVLREKFPIALPGEKVINIVSDESLEIIAPKARAPWWQKLAEIVSFWQK